MSLLALALYKYGGYMGFCSPANFYTGTKGPDRDDLHQAINILQARQFSAAGVENFLDLVDAGDLNNAYRAFNEVRECLAKGDYPVLSIANSFWGADAHTVIPYRVEENPSGYPPGTKIMYIWDSNNPYDVDPNHYADWNPVNKLVISGEYNWTYTSGIPPDTTAYSGSGWDSAWCFCVPMSKVLHKARQPMALDLVFDALLTVFISGPGAVLSQVSDEDGHRLFVEPRTSTEEVWEEDPKMRLISAFRWPYGRKYSPDNPELFFIVRSEEEKDRGISFAIDGASYQLILISGGNTFELKGTSTGPARDLIRLSGATSTPKLQITTSSPERILSLRRLQIEPGGVDWRGFLVSDLAISADTTVTIATVGDLSAVEIASTDTELAFALFAESKSKVDGLSRDFGRLTVPAGRRLQVGPTDWTHLDNTALERVLY
jgi:hypothetical protein